MQHSFMSSSFFHFFNFVCPLSPCCTWFWARTHGIVYLPLCRHYSGEHTGGDRANRSDRKAKGATQCTGEDGDSTPGGGASPLSPSEEDDATVPDVGQVSSRTHMPQVITYYGTGGGSFISEALLKFEGLSRGNPGGAGGAAVLLARSPEAVRRDPHGEHASLTDYSEVIATSWAGFNWATDMEAQYSGLILGLQLALNCGVTSLRVAGESLLVHKQMTGQCRVKAERLQPLYQAATDLLVQLRAHRTEMIHIPERFNSEPRQLATIAMDNPSMAYSNCVSFLRAGRRLAL
eukprot:m.22254 g.22254  ORF g.22254 m.22254 type:complete len:291 (-) comp3969_c0_seq2:312-1184(-)